MRRQFLRRKGRPPPSPRPSQQRRGRAGRFLLFASRRNYMAYSYGVRGSRCHVTHRSHATPWKPARSRSPTDKAAERHPDVFPLLLQRPAITSGSLLLRARIRGALLDCGVPAEDLDRGERLVSTVALGFLASEAGGRFHDVPPDQRDIDFEILLELVRQGLHALNGPRHHDES